VKYASAHDLRRAFGERWAARLMPAQLKELMRHESIETTLRFYVGTDAQRTADAAWAAFEASRPKNLEASGNSLANSATFGPPPPPTENRRKPKGRQVVIPSEAAGTRTQDQRIKRTNAQSGHGIGKTLRLSVSSVQWWGFGQSYAKSKPSRNRLRIVSFCPLWG
jgi:hypothetical protein